MKMMVYGTLKNGYWNNRLLAGATYLGEALTKKRYHMFGAGVPWIIPNAQGLPVKGEVFEIDEEQHLPFIDRLEGHPHGYTRTNIQAKLLATGEVVEVAIYEMISGIYGRDAGRVKELPPIGYYEWKY